MVGAAVSAAVSAVVGAAVGAAVSATDEATVGQPGKMSRLSAAVKCRGCPLQSCVGVVHFSHVLRLSTSVMC